MSNFTYRVLVGPLRIRRKPFGADSFGSFKVGDIVPVYRVEDVENQMTMKMAKWATLESGNFACIHDGKTMFMEQIAATADPVLKDNLPQTQPPESAGTRPLPGMHNDYAARQKALEKALDDVIAAVERLRHTEC